MNKQEKWTWRTKPLREAGKDNQRFWLQDRSSLTARLQSQGAFAVKLLRQELARPTGDEAVVLNIPPDQLAWVREVTLYCDGKPLVFAHTVLPYRPRGPLGRWLSRLGNQSLGALLFAHYGFQRGPLSCKRLDPRHALFLPAVRAMNLSDSPPPALWARRSTFVFRRQSVLVTEVFSPAIGAR